jgi:hypothetical protein
VGEVPRAQWHELCCTIGVFWNMLKRKGKS